MKFSALLFVFISFQALAFNICDYQDVIQFNKSQESSLVRRNIGAKPLSSLEQSLVFELLKHEEWRHVTNKKDAVLYFLDQADERSKPGPEAGEILYYRIEGKVVAYVHFYPGDTEVGAFFDVSNGQSFKTLGFVGDSEISCKK